MSARDQSVLTGYDIKINIDGMAFDEVWDDLIGGNADGVTCNEVLHFDLAPKDLAKLLRKGEIRDVIDEMRTAGANFVFVCPVGGKPIDGLSI